jgi:predicted amidohydrolase
MKFFVDSVSSYRADFILFPEYFNAALMSLYVDQNESSAIRLLAKETEVFVKEFSKLAIDYNVNIITGSMPRVNKKKLYNTSYLCRRDGSTESYSKIHITPAEKKYFGMEGAQKIKVFDTDVGKIAILICYDVEFPELSRALAEQGVQIIFVPFQTDTRNGYLRVRKCAEARAIENECYVAIAGCVGNMPKYDSIEINYAISAVFSPCDFNFPQEGIVSEASPNTENMLIADLDLTSLKELHHNGSVTNLKDRKGRNYKLTWKE